MTEHQWSEWFDHTPGPCPVPLGTWLEAVCLGHFGVKEIERGRITALLGSSWRAPFPGWIDEDGDRVSQVIRYRYRISKHLIELRQIAEDPIKTPEPVQ